MSTGVQINDDGWPYIYFDGNVHVSNDCSVAIDVRIASDFDRNRKNVRVLPGRGTCLPLPRPKGWTRDDDLDELLEPWTLYVSFVGSSLVREYPLINLEGEDFMLDVFVKKDFTVGNNENYV